MIASILQSRRIQRTTKYVAAWLTFVLLTGCWDSRDIDNLSIIQGVAIDANQQGELELTYQHLIAQKSKKNTYNNITTYNKDSIESASREQAQLVSRTPLYNFIRVVLISDQAIKKTRIDQLLDTFNRSYTLSRKSLVMVVNGTAKEALNKIGTHKETPSFALEALAKNSALNSEIPREISLGEISIHSSQGTDFIIQRLETSGSNHISGAALISGKTHKFTDWLDEKDVSGINWMLGNTKNTIIKTREPETKQLLVYEVEDVQSKIIPHLHEQELSFAVRIKTGIKLSENSVISAELLKEPFILTAKEAAQAEIKQTVLQALNKLQKEMKADVAGFGTRVKVKYPAYWDLVKQNWPETFNQIPVDVQTEVQIDRTGAYTKGAGM
jgi:spore germination protein